MLIPQPSPNTGPGTIGIPRGKANFDLITGKQLFDVSSLLAHVRDQDALVNVTALKQGQSSSEPALVDWGHHG